MTGSNFYLKAQSCVVDLHLFWSTYSLDYPGYIKKVKKMWILLYTMIKVVHTLYNTIICCRFGTFIIHLPRIFTFMRLKCKQCWLIAKLVTFSVEICTILITLYISPCGHWVNSSNFIWKSYVLGILNSYLFWSTHVTV